MSKLKSAFTLLIIVLVLLVGFRLDISRALADTAYEELQLFTDVLTIVRQSYVEDVSFQDLIYGAIDGMLVSLDPHSGFMSPELYREMKVDTRGEFGGLGIEITIRNGILTVVAPIEGTPADRAGLQSGDQILKIEDQFTKDMEIMEAVRLMRGKPGTEISISVMRDDFSKPQAFTLTREVIKIQSVKATQLDEGYGYIRISQFQEQTAQDLDKALAQFSGESGDGLKGLVVDLRNNPGGLLDQAVAVADMFLEDGLIVYTEGRVAEAQMKFAAEQDGTEPDYPLVLLINSGSASASEIVAGALQDHGRAVVMGTPSFGKGSVQTIIPLSDQSGLRLTTAKYYTPNGTSIQAKGIVPDIIVQPGEVKEVREPGHVREKDLRNHFLQTPDQDQTSAPQETGARPLDEELREDYQLMRALDLLKGWQIFQGLPAA